MIEIGAGIRKRIFKLNIKEGVHFMKLKLFFLSLSFYFSVLPFAEAYPWVFFRESQPKGKWHFELDTQASYFLNKKATGFFGSHLEYHHPTIDINVGWSYSFLEKEHYFRLSELSLAFPFLSERWRMNVGFRDVLWSEADRYWDYGLWQPRFLLDAFRPVQMGIPGIYLDYEGQGSLIFLISYFYLPDIIIYPQINNKTLFSKNPFFVNSLDFFKWNVDEIKLFQIKNFLKPVIAFQIKHSVKISNVSFSYAYKPVNQIQYSGLFKGPNLSIETKEDFAVQDFRYSLVPHHIATFEAETVFNKRFSLYTSFLYERPEKKLYEEKWISDGFEPHLTFSIISYFQEKLDRASKALFTFGYTKTIENNSYKQSSNILIEDLEEIFGRGFNWKEAVSFSMEYQSQEIFRGLLFRFRANYALDNHFYVLAMENYFNLTPRFQFYLSGDALFRLSEGLLDKNTSAIHKYSDLSRLLMGAKYVF